MDYEIIYSWCFNSVKFFYSTSSNAIIVLVENLESLSSLRSQHDVNHNCVVVASYDSGRRSWLAVVSCGWLLVQAATTLQAVTNGYYLAYKLITLSCILFMFLEMKFIHCHSYVMFTMKSMSMCND